MPDLYPITGTSPRRHAAPGDLADALAIPPSIMASFIFFVRPRK